MIDIGKDAFSKDHTIYWPTKYEGIVEFLKNGTGTEPSAQSLYSLNVEVIVLAACVGLVHNERIKILSEGKKEISLSTFASNGLAFYLYLIPMLSKTSDDSEPDLDMLRNEAGESRAIEIFQEFTAGGLSILNDELMSGGLKSPFLFVKDLATGHTFQEEGKRPKPTIKDIGIELF
jgi:dnd system-associated protein 4